MSNTEKLNKFWESLTRINAEFDNDEDYYNPVFNYLTSDNELVEMTDEQWASLLPKEAELGRRLTVSEVQEILK